MPVIFITAIDTGTGKSYATGLLGRYLLKEGKCVITQKLVQTGCEGRSEDIEIHRKIMGMEWNEDDTKNTTCPYLFRYPASPHLAAELEGVPIDPKLIQKATSNLLRNHEYVLLEGTGGLCVPLARDYLIIDYLAEQKYPVMVVTSSQLGSINHTIMTLKILNQRGLEIRGLLYNNYPEARKEIIADSRKLFQEYLYKMGSKAPVIDIPFFRLDDLPDINFGPLF